MNNKLTKVDKVFVPVSEDLIPFEFDVAGTTKDGKILGLKEQNNKYILSEDEFKKIVSDAIQFGIRKQSSFEIGGGKNVKLDDLTTEFLNNK